MNLEEAKDKVRLAIKDNTIYGSEGKALGDLHQP